MSEQFALFAEDSLVRTFQWPASARAWLEKGADFGSSSAAFLTALAQDGLLSRTSPACYPARLSNQEQTLPSSFEGWSNWGMASVGGFLTLNGSEFPNDADACSLSDILETVVPPKYSLSPKVCAGILRRAEKRGKALPEQLVAALEAVVGRQTPTA